MSDGARTYPPVIFCLVALLLGGCVDSSEVWKFADISKSASTCLPALVTDIEASCKRRTTYAPAEEPQTSMVSCQKFTNSQPGILKAQQVLLDYMDALKSLAGDQSVTYGKKLDALPGELSDSGLNKDQVKAVTGLAKIVADAALKGYRQKQLQDLIGSANEDVQLITKALGEIITTAIDAIRTGQPSSSAPSLNPDARCRAASTFTKAFRRVTHD